MRISETANLYAQSVYADHMRYAINNRNEQVMTSNNLLPQQIFTPQFNPQQYLQGLSNFQTESQNTYENIQDIMDRDTFNSRNVINETPEDISISADNSARGMFELSVSQLAQSQVNESLIMNPNNSDFSYGQNSFEIGIGEETYNFGVEIFENDTNMDVLNRIETSINDQNIGITANINETDDGISLVLESDETGTNQQYTINDTEGSLISNIQLDNTTQQAQDLVFNYNDEEITQQTNLINLEDGIEVNVFNTGDFTFEIDYNRDQISNDVEELVGELNNYLNYANENADNLSDRALDRIDRITDFASSLERYGINFNDSEGNFEITDSFYDMLNEEDNLYSVQNTMNMVGEYALNRIEDNANSSLYELDNTSYNGISGAMNFGAGRVNDTLMGAYMQQNMIGNLLTGTFNGYA